MKYIGVSTPAYSFSKKPKYSGKEDEKVTKNVSFHDLAELIKKNRSARIAWTFDKRPRPMPGDDAPQSPPVGSYEMRKEPLAHLDNPSRQAHDRKKKFSRDTIYRKETGAPPGAYDLTTNYYPRPGASMGYKGEDLALQSNKNPGPGAYELTSATIEKAALEKKKLYQRRNLLRSKAEARRATERSEDTQDLAKETQSMYVLPDSLEELRKGRSKKGTFPQAGLSKSSDKPRKREKPQPGPGSYYFSFDLIKDSMEKGRGAKILGKLKPGYSTADDTPGPGKYEVGASAGKFRPAFSMPKSLRDLGLLSKKGLPGPGDYDLRLPARATKSASMSRDRRHIELLDSVKSATPGPGAYDLVPEKRDGPQFSIRLRTRQHSSFNSAKQSRKLGPGCYEPDYNSVLSRTRTTEFPRSVRDALERSRSAKRPGVGDYSIEREGANLKTGFTFSSARRGLSPREEPFPLPGPGAYTLKPTVPQLQKHEQDRLDLLGNKISLD